MSAQRIRLRVRMIAQVAHERGSHVEPYGGIVRRIDLKNAADVPREARQAVGGEVTASRYRVLVVDESRPYLAKDTEVLKPGAHFDAIQPLQYRLRTLLGGYECRRAVERDPTRKVVVKVESNPRQVLAACRSVRTLIREDRQANVVVLRADLPMLEWRPQVRSADFGRLRLRCNNEVVLRSRQHPWELAGEECREAPARLKFLKK